MINKLITVLLGMAIGGSATLFAQESSKPANIGEGTVMVKGKSYLLKNAVAYETTIDGEEGTAVILSGPTISSEKLSEARKSESKGRALVSGGLTSSWSSRRQGNSKAGALASATRRLADAPVAMRPANYNCRMAG